MTKPKSAHTTGRENIVRWDVVRAAHRGTTDFRNYWLPESVCHPCQSVAYPCRVAEPNLVHEEPGHGRKQVRVMDYAAERNGRFLGGLFVSGFAL
jgi:hypothetical protein